MPLERLAEGLTAKVLSELVVKLVHFGILEKKNFPEIPPRAEYHRTPFGRRLVSILDQVEPPRPEQTRQPRRDFSGLVAEEIVDQRVCGGGLRHGC